MALQQKRETGNTISELEDRKVEITQSENREDTKVRKMNRAAGTFGTNNKTYLCHHSPRRAESGTRVELKMFLKK